MYNLAKNKKRALYSIIAHLLTASGGGKPCYERILDALSLRKVESVKTFRNSETLAEELLKLSNRDSSVVTLPLSDDRLRHSEALAEESLKNLLFQLWGARCGRIARKGNSSHSNFRLSLEFHTPSSGFQPPSPVEGEGTTFRHSERSEESLKNLLLTVGEGAVVLAKASYKCWEGVYPMKKGGLNYA